MVFKDWRSGEEDFLSRVAVSVRGHESWALGSDFRGCRVSVSVRRGVRVIIVLLPFALCKRMQQDDRR